MYQLVQFIKTYALPIFCLQETHIGSNDINGLKAKYMDKYIPCKQ